MAAHYLCCCTHYTALYTEVHTTVHTALHCTLRYTLHYTLQCTVHWGTDYSTHCTALYTEVHTTVLTALHCTWYCTKLYIITVTATVTVPSCSGCHVWNLVQGRHCQYWWSWSRWTITAVRGSKQVLGEVVLNQSA